jgi:heme/copper-type cytochrome/quinol oxidase subunit 3
MYIRIFLCCPKSIGEIVGGVSCNPSWSSRVLTFLYIFFWLYSVGILFALIFDLYIQERVRLLAYLTVIFSALLRGTFFVAVMHDLPLETHKRTIYGRLIIDIISLCLLSSSGTLFFYRHNVENHMLEETVYLGTTLVLSVFYKQYDMHDLP